LTLIADSSEDNPIKRYVRDDDVAGKRFKKHLSGAELFGVGRRVTHFRMIQMSGRFVDRSIGPV
jgi:hypothetical protein